MSVERKYPAMTCYGFFHYMHALSKEEQEAVPPTGPVKPKWVSYETCDHADINITTFMVNVSIIQKYKNVSTTSKLQNVAPS